MPHLQLDDTLRGMQKRISELEIQSRSNKAFVSELENALHIRQNSADMYVSLKDCGQFILFYLFCMLLMSRTFVFSVCTAHLMD